MALGLFRGIIRLSIRREVSHWCLAAEPSLLRRLRGLGLHFEPAGPLVEHRGLRQICYAEVTELLARVEAERPEIWDVMTLGGLLLSDEPARTVACTDGDILQNFVLPPLPRNAFSRRRHFQLARETVKRTCRASVWQYVLFSVVDVS